MESAAKRKASSAAAGENDTRSAKRQKPTPAEPAREVETAATTTEKGLRFLDSLKQAKDKTGRSISTHFLELPDKDELPDYYVHIKLPISIQIMEDKLTRGEYLNLAQLESDCKRLVNNAKIYNDKKSLVYEDAERLRKTASNWMTKHNPAYRIKGYQAVATPVPGEEVAASTPAKPARSSAATPRNPPATPATPEVATERPRRAAAPLSNTPIPSRLRQSHSAAPASPADGSFEGKTFQQAQEQIINSMIDYQEDNVYLFSSFVTLPPRQLKDYYQLIKDPRSLSGVKKKIAGVVGRANATGVSLYKSWTALEEDMAMIWINARTYNEDGSPIYNLSLKLEETFKDLLAQAKAKVDEPTQPKLKINMSGQPKQQLKIKLRRSPDSEAVTPAARGSATPGVSIDNDALLRQQRLVHDGMSGSGARSSSASEKLSTPAPSAPSAPLAPSATPAIGMRGASASVAPAAAASPAPTNGIKSDVHSPALSSIRPASTVPDAQPSVSSQTSHPSMPPPQSTSRASGSPFPAATNGHAPAAVQQPNGFVQPTSNHYPPAQPYYPPPTATQAPIFRKTPLKSFDDALIPKITVTTAPILNLPKPFSQVLHASKQKTRYSYTLMLPSTHTHLHIMPFLPVALTGRPWRTFYFLNGKPYSETPRVNLQMANGAPATYESGRKKGEPLYEAKLQPGVTNKIEIEVIAEKDRKGRPLPEGVKDFKELCDVEKCTIFVHFVR